MLKEIQSNNNHIRLKPQGTLVVWASSLDRFRELDRVDCYLRSLQGDLWKQQAGQASGLRWLRGKVLQILTLQSADDLDCMDTVSRDTEHVDTWEDVYLSTEKKESNRLPSV